MKESLELLNIPSSGLEIPTQDNNQLKEEKDVLLYLNKLNSDDLKEKYLTELLSKRPFGYIEAKIYLAKLIIKKNLQFAYELSLGVCHSSPTSPKGYFLLAEIALENNAWLVAKDALEIVKWLCLNSDNDTFSKASSLYELVLKNISNNKEVDNSKSAFWFNKGIAKFWLLERLYYQAKWKSLVHYSFKLLDCFSQEKSNYDVVFKVLSLLNNDNVTNQFIDKINSYLKDDNINKNLYLGLSHYLLEDYEKSISYLTETLKVNPLNSKALFFSSLISLLKNDLKKFRLLFERIVPEVAPEFNALYFIYSALINIACGKTEYPNQKNISSEIVKILTKLSTRGQKELAYSLIEGFQKLGHFVLLPYLRLYLAEMFINQNMLDRAKELLIDCKDIEVYRLNAWICRIEGKEEQAERELVNYRKNLPLSSEGGIECQAIDLSFPDFIPNDINEVINLVESAYTETKELINKLDLEYGLNSMTCIETSCQDCCTKTFPYISYTEYLYLRNWLDKQDKELRKKINEESIEVENLYREKYKKDPPFLIGEDYDLRKEYPKEFVFSCPCLGNNKCNVYEGRPFTCRAFSYGSPDGIRFKGCNYFYNQLKGATKLTNARKVINMASFFKFTKTTDEKLIGKKVIAPIPVWFAHSHEETLIKLNKAMNSLLVM